MGSGVIYAVIVLLWAVFLVPMWLRRHDTEAEVRQVDRFSKAMSILRRDTTRSSRASKSFEGGSADAVSTRTDGAVIGPEEVASRTAGSGPLTALSLGPRSRSVDAPVSQVFVSRPRSAQLRSAQATRLRRRRRVLIALGTLLVVTGLLSGFGIVGLWAPAASLVLGAGYLVMLRRYAIADAQARRHAERVASRPAMPAVIDLTDEPSVAPRSDRELAQNERVAVDADARVWSPSSPPLPTYVTAPAATTVPRVIDRAASDGLTASRMVELAEASKLASGIDASPAADEVWAEATRDAVFDREFFESGVARDGFAEAVEDEVELIVGERPRRRHPSHDIADAADAASA